VSVLGSLAAAQSAVEYGVSTSSGGLGAIADRIGHIASAAAGELDRLVSFAVANPALTMLVAALVCVAVIVRSVYLRG